MIQRLFVWNHNVPNKNNNNNNETQKLPPRNNSSFKQQQSLVLLLPNHSTTINNISYALLFVIGILITFMNLIFLFQILQEEQQETLSKEDFNSPSHVIVTMKNDEPILVANHDLSFQKTNQESSSQSLRFQKNRYKNGQPRLQEEKKLRHDQPQILIKKDAIIEDTPTIEKESNTNNNNKNDSKRQSHHGKNDKNVLPSNHNNNKNKNRISFSSCTNTTKTWDNEKLDRFLHLRSELYQEDVDHCIPMHSWQMEYHPSCNVIHEIHMTPYTLEFVAEGTTTVVYELVSLETKQQLVEKEKEDTHRFVFKVPMFDRSFTTEEYEMRRIDAIIQEELVASPYVGNIYAFCGQSSIVPLATGGSIHDLIVSVRAGGQEPTPLDKLKVCIQIAQGLAALHGIGGNDCDTDSNRPSFAHNDLDVSQHVFVNGIFQINDFSYGFMLLQHDATHETCKGRSYMGRWKYRAPEDFNYGKQDGGPYLLEKADVFMMCNEFYMVLTNLWLLEDLSRSQGANAIGNGQRSPIPQDILDDPNEAIQAIVKAITTMCWHQDPNERWTARQIADFLQGELEKMDPSSIQKDGIVRVTLPPLVQASGDYDELM